MRTVLASWHPRRKRHLLTQEVKSAPLRSLLAAWGGHWQGDRTKKMEMSEEKTASVASTKPASFPVVVASSFS